MESFEIQYVYSQSEQEQLEASLDNLQQRLGGKRKPYFAKGGAIDLVSLLQLLVIFTAGISIKPVLQKYFEGLLNADGEIKYLSNQGEFIKTFHPVREDSLKFLVSPFWRQGK